MPVPAVEHALQPYDPAAYGPAAPPAEETGGALSVGRFMAAMSRYKWLVVVLVLLGLGGGFVATRFIDPEYEVNATIFTSGSGTERPSLINPSQLTGNAGWRDLMQSFAIIDPVVQKLSLYIQPDKASDSLLFATFQIDPVKKQFRPGSYTLKTEHGRFTLTDKVGFTHEVGTVGDSVGRSAGFAWVPPARLLGTRSREVSFTVLTPREASRDVQKRLAITIKQSSPVIALSLTGTAQQKPAATMNAMLTQFVDVATELK